jgi:hypothetical protein
VSKYVEETVYESAVIAVILQTEYHQKVIELFRPSSFSQQLAYMRRRAGYRIVPYFQNEMRRLVTNCQTLVCDGINQFEWIFLRSA